MSVEYEIEITSHSEFGVMATIRDESKSPIVVGGIRKFGSGRFGFCWGYFPKHIPFCLTRAIVKTVKKSIEVAVVIDTEILTCDVIETDDIHSRFAKFFKFEPKDRKAGFIIMSRSAKAGEHL